MSPKYAKPPVVEVACDFRFNPTAGEEWDATIPGAVYTVIAPEFPKKRIMQGMEVSFEKGTAVTRSIEKLQFFTDDEKFAIQIEERLFAISRLKPYTGWDNFLPVVQRNLEKFCEISKLSTFSRLGVKYVNRMTIPHREVRLEDYFRFYPGIEGPLPQLHGPFMLGVEFPFATNQLRLELKSAASANPDTYSAILDLDFFTTNAGTLNLQDVRQWLNEAHVRLGECFEQVVKPKLRDLFEPVG
jgi:uncharacterized protein (TIGR04255 family)